MKPREPIGIADVPDAAPIDVVGGEIVFIPDEDYDPSMWSDVDDEGVDLAGLRSSRPGRRRQVRGLAVGTVGLGDLACLEPPQRQLGPGDDPQRRVPGGDLREALGERVLVAVLGVADPVVVGVLVPTQFLDDLAASTVPFTSALPRSDKPPPFTPSLAPTLASPLLCQTHY